MALSLTPGAKLVVATHNPGKARELQAILENRFEVLTAGELGLPEPEETEATFVGNALLKARAAA
jgi:XTP/dITP diphosphohydrolase